MEHVSDLGFTPLCVFAITITYEVCTTVLNASVCSTKRF